MLLLLQKCCFYFQTLTVLFLLFLVDGLLCLIVKGEGQGEKKGGEGSFWGVEVLKNVLGPLDIKASLPLYMKSNRGH